MFDAGTYVIAEAGVNHNGSIDLAHRMIDEAAGSRADAIKFQTFRHEDVVSAATPLAAYQAANTGSDGDQAAMLSALELTHDDFAALARHCARAGIDFLSTAFDTASARFLAGLGMKYIKSPSGEITNPELLRSYGSFGRPVILSTGMATLGEVEQGIAWVREGGATDIVVLHCVSDYPAAPSDANLAAMDSLRAAFGLPVGWSDHTLGDAVTLAAVARGACVIEKHFTLDTAMPGPDHKASLDVPGLAAMIARIRIVEAAIGDGRKGPTRAELGVRAVARRSVVARRDIAPGAVITAGDLVFLRPGTGIAPAHAELIAGRRATRAIAGGALLDWGDFA